jgi:hypothetical protein
MPESVTDRPTKAHEYIFLLSKSREYFYDADAIREPVSAKTEWTYSQPDKAARMGQTTNGTGQTTLRVEPTDGNRNRRSVWTVATKPFSGAHFAVFPPDLIEPCILAGTSAKGCCAKCGAPWVRMVEREAQLEQGRKSLGYGKSTDAGGFTTNGHGGSTLHHDVSTTTIGWQPTCTCNADVVPCTVLDPFNGSGTTGAVSLKHHRRYIGIELNPEYIELAHRRIGEMQPLLLGV